MEEIKTNQYVDDTNSTIIKVFFRMFLGLLATGLTALYTYKSGMYISILSGVSYSVLAITEVAIVLIFSWMFRKLSPTIVTVLFYLYAFINGITMSVIFAAFEMNTIFYAFFTTALLFGGLALYGYETKADMTKIGTILKVGLIVGLIVSIINLFIGNTIIDIALDWIMLLIFCGLTIYDMNKISYMQEYVEYDTEKFYIYGAMELYLDFINIFIRLLSIMGRSRRD
ncbi:MAG: Bax inhibitor-1/YccA family protein [Clostridia bacterium]|nr:Bax inhibitor-1/YccA family protein [Clostridia bacterium]